MFILHINKKETRDFVFRYKWHIGILDLKLRKVSHWPTDICIFQLTQAIKSISPISGIVGSSVTFPPLEALCMRGEPCVCHPPF